MTPAELLTILKGMTKKPWTVENNGDGYITGHITAKAHRYCGNSVGRRDSVTAPDSMTVADATGIAALRNHGEALVNLWAKVEAYRAASAAVDADNCDCNDRCVNDELLEAENRAIKAMLVAAAKIGA